MKEIVILGGPNGAGKTTAARVFLREFLNLYAFVNADELARGIDSGGSNVAALAAGRLMLKRIEELITDRSSKTDRDSETRRSGATTHTSSRRRPKSA